MKKKFLIALSVVVAAFAAAFAIGGCKFKDGSSSGINEYVVWNDGCGKTYTLRGGENVVAYYPCESDKILNFSYVYYNAATGEATREVAERGRLNLGEPFPNIPLITRWSVRGRKTPKAKYLLRLSLIHI